MFADALAHLHAELTRLDLLLHRQILRLRASYQLSLDEFRGLYISDEQVDALLHQVLGKESSPPTILDLTRRAEAMRESNNEQCGEDLPWKHISRKFHLQPFEQDVLLLALAPEIDLKYETLYAYLNNDVTRKWPTIDLALRLFSNDTSNRLQLRKHLSPEGILFSSSLLQPIPFSPEHPAWLSEGFFLTRAVSQYLLGLPFRDARLTPFAEYGTSTRGWDDVPVSASLRAELSRISHFFRPTDSENTSPLLVFEGRDGSGRRQAAEAICRDLGLPLLCVDLEAAHSSPEALQKVVQGLTLQQRLQPVGIYLQRTEVLFEKEGHSLPEGHRMVRVLAQVPGPVFFACEAGTRWRELMKGQRCLAFHFGDPDYSERYQLWERYIQQAGCTLSESLVEALAARFVLASGQIKNTVSAAIDTSKVKAEAVSFETFAEAARAQSSEGLGRLAVKVNTIHTWDDLVLPSRTLRRVKEIAATIRYRHIVYSQWNFERRIASGKSQGTFRRCFWHR